MRNRKIVQYRTVFVTDESIDELVNDFIKTGWQPIGGISMFWHDNSDENDVSYCQAMVKYEED